MGRHCESVKFTTFGGGGRPQKLSLFTLTTYCKLSAVDEWNSDPFAEHSTREKLQTLRIVSLTTDDQTCEKMAVGNHLVHDDGDTDIRQHTPRTGHYDKIVQ